MTAPDSEAADDLTWAAEPGGRAPTTLDDVRVLSSQATQQLLGATIDVTDEQWRGPSRLPGWTRGHVASHLARNAEAIGRLAEWAETGERQEMYPSAEQRDADIGAGADRSGLELQVDLDTAAGRLEERFAALDESERWDHQVEVRSSSQPARMLPLFRLVEVVLHHVDLDIGFTIDDVDDDSARWVLEFVAVRLADREDYPRLDLSTAGGFHAVVGSGDHPRPISGTDQQVLGWLTGRGGDLPDGADGIELPAYA